MLTVSRQVGTAIGVAVLGAVYLARIDSALPGIAEGDQNIEAVAAAAEHFIAAGDTATQAAAGQVIVDGFLAISAATIVLGLLAAVASLFIRNLPQQASEEPPTTSQRVSC